MAKAPTIDEALAILEGAHPTVDSRVTTMIKTYGGAIYSMDFLVAAALNRTRANIKAFIQLIRDRNLVIAGALLRIQIDTALRVSAAFLVDDPHGFANRVLQGDRIDRINDRNGARLTDRSLVNALSPDFPWLERVYEKTSGYIHLSGTHIHHIFNNIQEDGHFQIKVAEMDRDLPDELYTEAIEAFFESIQILFKYVDGWIFTKENPELVQKLKNEIQENHGNA